MKNLLKAAVVAVFSALLVGCASGTAGTADRATDSICFKYARYIKVYNYDGYRKAVIINPWDTTKLLHTYIISADSAFRQEGTTFVRIPSERAVMMSSVHVGLLNQLGELNRINGVCDASYINLKQAKDLMAKGSIADYGNGAAPNIEAIVTGRADMIMASPFEGSTGYGKLETIGLPIIECADYAEVSPLARAEWMKFYGILFGCEKKADSLFSVVERNYLQLKQEAGRTSSRPKVMDGLMYQGTWYVQGGRSTTGELYRDAALSYIFSSQKENTLPLSFEQVLLKTKDADLWFVKHASPFSLSLMLGENAKYSQFKSYVSRKVYVAYTDELIFDEAPFRPDILLRDIVSIAHPELAESSSRYYKHIDK